MCSSTGKRLALQAFRFELDPNRAQRVLLAKSVGARRFVYNWGLAESQREYELAGKRPRLGDLKSRLVELKNAEAPWLYEVSAHIGQQALVDLDRAFDRFFKGLRGEALPSGRPRFKRKGERDSARLYGVTLGERHLHLPKIGRARLKETRSSRGFEGRILSATISRRADRWFVSLAVEHDRVFTPLRPVRAPADVVGIDLGLTAAAVIHDGSATRVIEPRRPLRHSLQKLRRLDRQLARRQRGSRNREKASLRRARLYYKVSCQRQDFLHQLTSSLTRTKSVIVLEDLNVKGMGRNPRVALSIADAGMGELRRQLAYKSEWYGSTLLLADRFFPSSKLCSRCGTVKDGLGLRERLFECDACGLSLGRDENAAINLRRGGLVGLPEGLREVTPVERKALAQAVNARNRPRRSRKRQATQWHPQIGEETRRGISASVGSTIQRHAAPPQ